MTLNEWMNEWMNEWTSVFQVSSIYIEDSSYHVMFLINANHENKNQHKKTLTIAGVLPNFNSVPVSMSKTMSKRYKNE